MMHVGDILSTVRDLQYRGGYHDKCGGYHDKCGGYLSTVGVFSTEGGIMCTVRGYLEYHLGVLSTFGRYHDARGGIS